MRGSGWLVGAALLGGACSAGGGAGGPSPTTESSVVPVSTSLVRPTTTLSTTTVSTTVTPSTTTEPVPMALVPGDAWIVYQGPFYERDEGVGNRLVRPDGSDDHWATPQVPLPKDGWQAHPDWSPDGALLAFVADDADDDAKSRDLMTRDLWVSRPDGTAAERVLNCVLPCVEARDPAWSPDGTKLAFVEFDENDGTVVFSLRSMDVESRAVTTLMTAAGTDHFAGPRWSPDGQRIVLELSHWPDEALTETAIAIVDLRDSPPAPQVITDWSMWATYPDWHPEEDLIVFSTRPWTVLAEGPSNLYTTRPDGSDLTPLTEFGAGQTRAVQPTWTPDGTRIIFTAVEGTGFGEPTMAIIERDGTGLRPATASGPMFGTHPRLRPGVDSAP